MAEIETPRLRMRPIEASDAQELFRLINNWNVVRWLTTTPWPYVRSDMDGFIEKVTKAGPAAEKPHTILIGGQPCGVFGYRQQHNDAGTPLPRCHIGYWLGEPYWGNGYMTEAARAMTAHLFAEPSLQAICSAVLEGNGASLRVQTKLGFQITTSDTIMSRPCGKPMPIIRTSLPRNAFISK